MSIVAFDVDGVIAHCNKSWITATNIALANRDIPAIEEEHFAGFAASTLESWIMDVVSFVGVIDNTESFKLEYLKCHNDVVKNIKPQLYDGIFSVLEKLLENEYPLCIISNRPLNDYECEIAPLLDGIHFDYIRCRDKVDSNGMHNGNAKPNANYLDEVLRHFHCNPCDIVYIGDVYEDYLFAKKTGMKFIQAAWGYDNNGRLSNLYDVLKANTPEQLFDIITSFD